MVHDTGLVNEIKATIQEIENVSISAKVIAEKNEVPQVFTTVKFEYMGRPSAMEPILELAAKGKPINIKFYSPQLALFNESDKEIKEEDE